MLTSFVLLQSECLKHILFNLREDRNALCDPILALGRDTTKVETNRTGSSLDPDPVHQHVAHRLKVLQTLVDAQKSALKKLTHCLREAEVQKATLVIILELKFAQLGSVLGRGGLILPVCLAKGESRVFYP